MRLARGGSNRLCEPASRMPSASEAIASNVIHSADIAPIILCFLVRTAHWSTSNPFDKKRHLVSIVLARWLCASWARKFDATWRAICYEHWPCTKRFKKIRDFKAFYFNRVCSFLQCRPPRLQPVILSRDDLHFTIKIGYRKSGYGRNWRDVKAETLLELALDGSAATATSDCAHFWPDEDPTETRDVGLCWDIGQIGAVVAQKIGIATERLWEKTVEKLCQSDLFASFELTVSVFRASTQSTLVLMHDEHAVYDRRNEMKGLFEFEGDVGHLFCGEVRTCYAFLGGQAAQGSARSRTTDASGNWFFSLDFCLDHNEALQTSDQIFEFLLFKTHHLAWYGRLP